MKEMTNNTDENLVIEMNMMVQKPSRGMKRKYHKEMKRVCASAMDDGDCLGLRLMGVNRTQAGAMPIIHRGRWRAERLAMAG